MPHANDLFWAAVIIVAVLAAVLLVRVFPKRRNLSRAERARRDRGSGPDDLDGGGAPPPPDKKA